MKVTLILSRFWVNCVKNLKKFFENFDDIIYFWKNSERIFCKLWKNIRATIEKF